MFLHPVRTLATASSDPSKTASTVPSGRFLTHPLTPSLIAMSLVLALNQTPWTRPWNMTCALTDIEDRPDLSWESLPGHIILSGLLEKRLLNRSRIYY
jgi:hypothetical protein